MDSQLSDFLVMESNQSTFIPKALNHTQRRLKALLHNQNRHSFIPLRPVLPHTFSLVYLSAYGRDRPQGRECDHDDHSANVAQTGRLQTFLLVPGHSATGATTATSLQQLNQ